MSKFLKLSTGHLEERVLRLLSETGPISPAEYADVAGVPKSTADRWLGRLHAQKTLHVATRTHNPHGTATPRYFFGKLPDAKHPPKITDREKTARYVARIKAEQPEKWQAIVRQNNQKMRERERQDVELAERRRMMKAKWAAKKRNEVRGGPAPTKCPMPRPKTYRNIFEEQRIGA